MLLNERILSKTINIVSCTALPILSLTHAPLKVPRG